MEPIDTYTRDELYEMTQDHDIDGHGDMSKQELFDALANTTLADEFPDVQEVEEGDEVEMNFLKSTLVTEIEEEVGEVPAMVMETNRGGRHRLTMTDDEGPRLQRWRAGDEEWMWDSDYPIEFTVLD